MQVVTQEFLYKLFTGWLAGEMNGAIAHFFKNNIVPDAFSVAADFTETTITGWAPFAFAGPGQRAFFNGNGTLESASVIGANATPASVNDFVYGFWAESGSVAGKVLFAGRFDQPMVVLAAPQAGFICTLGLVFQNKPIG